MKLVRNQNVRTAPNNEKEEKSNGKSKLTTIKNSDPYEDNIDESEISRSHSFNDSTPSDRHAKTESKEKSKPSGDGGIILKNEKMKDDR